MGSVHDATASSQVRQEQEKKRLQRLVAASRSADAVIPDIDEVLQARFHPSHSSVLAFVSYIDDTRGIVWAAYRGSVHLISVDVPSVLHRALQLSPPKVALRINDGATAHITAIDIYRKPQTYECTLPEL